MLSKIQYCDKWEFWVISEVPSDQFVTILHICQVCSYSSVKTELLVSIEEFINILIVRSCFGDSYVSASLHTLTLQ